MGSLLTGSVQSWLAGVVATFSPLIALIVGFEGRLVPLATPRRDVRSRATWGSRGHWRLMGGHRPRSAVLVAGYHGADLISPTVNFRATIPSLAKQPSHPNVSRITRAHSGSLCDIDAR